MSAIQTISPSPTEQTISKQVSLLLWHSEWTANGRCIAFGTRGTAALVSAEIPVGSKGREMAEIIAWVGLGAISLLLAYLLYTVMHDH